MTFSKSKIKSTQQPSLLLLPRVYRSVAFLALFWDSGENRLGRAVWVLHAVRTVPAKNCNGPLPLIEPL